MEHTWEREVVGAATYLLNSKDEQVEGAVRQMKEMAREGKKCLPTEARDVLERRGMVADRLPLGNDDNPIDRKQMKRDLAQAQVKVMVEELQGRMIHGVYAENYGKPRQI